MVIKVLLQCVSNKTLNNNVGLQFGVYAEKYYYLSCNYGCEK